jgi:hypothetical protein
MMKKWADIKAKDRSAEHLARLDAEVEREVLALNLRALEEEDLAVLAGRSK